MPASIGSGGAWKGTLGWNIGAGGVWKSILGMWIGAGGAWKSFFASLAVSASNVSGFVDNNSPCATVFSSGSPNPIVTGGSGSYTYAWSFVAVTSGFHTPPFSINNASAANPTWSKNVCCDSCIETWRLTVTDTVTGAVASTDITVTLIHTSPFC